VVFSLPSKQFLQRGFTVRVVAGEGSGVKIDPA
jgi:hypothetical protein